MSASDKATAALIRRTLCPTTTATTTTRPASESELLPLPPLTSSNDVDLQLYGLLAVVVREFVLTWYGNVTPDTAFVEELVKVVAHCTRALEQRLREVNFELLLLDEIPRLVGEHVTGQLEAKFPLVGHPLHVYFPFQKRGLGDIG